MLTFCNYLRVLNGCFLTLPSKSSSRDMWLWLKCCICSLKSDEKMEYFSK